MVDEIICGDCLEVLPTLEAKSINLIILDLPYNVSYKLNYNHKRKIENAEWDKIQNYMTFVGNVYKECERVLKDSGSLYWFHNNFNTIVDVYSWLRDNSQLIFKQFIVWNKKFKGASNEGYLQGYNEVEGNRNYHQMAEYILYFTFQDATGLTQTYGNDNCFKPIKEYMRQERINGGLRHKQINQILGTTLKGGGLSSHFFGSAQWVFPTKDMYTKLQTTGYFTRDYEELRAEYEKLRYTFNNQKTHHSVWNYPIEKKVGHITPKPVALIETIVDYSSNEGDIVLDPTCGSGTTAVACKRSDRHYICIEKEQGYCAIAEKRVSEML